MLALFRKPPTSLLLASLFVVGCTVDAEDPLAGPPSQGGPVTPDFDDDEDEEEPAEEPEEPADDEPSGPRGFAHEGSWVGTCTFVDMDPFQVDITLDQWGRGMLRRHDIGLVEIDAAAMTDGEGMSIVEGVWGGIVFRAHLYAEEGGSVEAECFELVPSDGEGDGMECMFPDNGCPSNVLAYDIAHHGELTLVRKR
jgi:hypothetical protein